MEAKDIIGTHIFYKDYLGIERAGIIGWFEDYKGDEPDEDGLKTVWLYVCDEDPEYNTHQIVVDMGQPGRPDLKTICYADMRLSTEVRLDN